MYSMLTYRSLGWGPNNYFNQSDVQKAIYAPPTNYAVCGDPTLFPHGDKSLPSALGPLPNVIDKTKNVIIGHGLLDFLLIANGSLATIQNMTVSNLLHQASSLSMLTVLPQFGGLQGFQKAPTPNNFYVPYHASLGQIISEVLYQGNIPSEEIYANTDVAGAGIYGSAHTERGLTFVQTKLAGHEIPQVS